MKTIIGIIGIALLFPVAAMAQSDHPSDGWMGTTLPNGHAQVRQYKDGRLRITVETVPGEEYITHRYDENGVEYTEGNQVQQTPKGSASWAGFVDRYPYVDRDTGIPYGKNGMDPNGIYRGEDHPEWYGIQMLGMWAGDDNHELGFNNGNEMNPGHDWPGEHNDHDGTKPQPAPRPASNGGTYIAPRPQYVAPQSNPAPSDSKGVSDSRDHNVPDGKGGYKL